MNSCKLCGSMAVNDHLYGRVRGVDLDLCDVHYWSTRANILTARVAELERANTALSVALRRVEAQFSGYAMSIRPDDPRNDIILGTITEALVNHAAEIKDLEDDDDARFRHINASIGISAIIKKHGG